MERKQKTLIRTGCLACRAAGIPCNPNNPGCKRNESTQWASNHEPTEEGMQLEISRRYARGLPTITLNASGWQGTNRELQSLHFFNIVSAPELAGYVDCAFWQTYILEQIQQDEAIMHAVAALGAHHEYRLRHQASRYNMETEGLWRFALRQCNKAIKSLLAPMHDVGTKGDVLLRMLTASLLFVCFESMAGRKEAALSHVLHARRLTTHSKRLLKDGPSGGIDRVTAEKLRVVEPLVAHYESQLSSFRLRRDDKAAVERLVIDQPIVIEHLIDARMALYRAVFHMTDIIFALDDASTEADVTKMALRKHALSLWCQRWEVTFADFMSRKKDQMSMAEIVHSKLILTHYYAMSVICATDVTKGEDNWANFTPQLKEILRLATEIIDVQPHRAISSQAPQTPYFSSTMGLSQPLYICASRCVDLDIASKAVKLLGKLPPSEGAKSQYRTELLERHLRVASGDRRQAFTQVQELSSSSASPA